MTSFSREREPSPSEARRDDTTLSHRAKQHSDEERVETCFTESFRSSPAVSPDTLPESRSAATSDRLSPGQRIGRFRIERLLDRGGMGVVYLAARADDFEQRVALKLVDPDLHTGEILERFYRERQILADLQHPNIAHLLDGGSTDQALPYFAMEYVDGQPIDRYCDEQALSIRERLELFCQVCEAVHFAHQSLVVHRDLKPSNILVTADRVPKLLDFGIAKILQSEAAVSPPLSRRQPLTPGYASPEQLLDKPITTASDIYSLGVLLYRLMSGEAPYLWQGGGVSEMVELICHRQPIRPSRAVWRASRGKADRGTAAVLADRQARRLRRQLAGDIDAIILKAMDKEPQQRYGSALQLAEDLQRHLADLPVKARQGTGLYVAGKFARRHTLALALLAMVVVFALTATVLWRRAVDERARAEQERARALDERSQAEQAQLKAERVSHFLEELFESADPDASRGAAIPVREILDRGRLKISEGLADHPEVRAEMSSILGTVYNNLGLYSEARELKEEGLRWRRASSPVGRPELATDLNNLARLLYDLADYSEAKEHLQEALAIWRRLGDDAETATTLLNLAVVATHQGRHDDALDLHQQVLEIRSRLFGPQDPKVASSLYSLGVVHFTSGRSDLAEPLLRQAYEIYKRHFGIEHTKVASVLGSLGRALHAQQRHAEARDCLQQALSIRRRLLDADHPHVARAEKSLAALWLDQGEVAAAGDLLRQALATLRRKKPAGDWQIADTESVWGAYLAAEGRHDEAESYLVTSYRELLRIRGPHDIYTRDALHRLVRSYEAAGQLAKAEELLAESRAP